MLTIDCATGKAALLEVLGIFVAGPLVMMLLMRLLGLQPVNPLNRFTVDITDAELHASHHARRFLVCANNTQQFF